ncbi:hypothetical protein V1507DRAFT_437432 [Lipomyces tetrasporus]
MVNYQTPTSDSASDNFYSDSEDMSDPANASTNDNLPSWLQQFLQVQHDTVNTQQQQMLQLIQLQGQRLDHMAGLFAQGQSLNQGQAHKNTLVPRRVLIVNILKYIVISHPASVTYSATPTMTLRPTGMV